MRRPIRTLVVDDEPAARRRIVRLCQAHADIRVVGQAGTAADAVELLSSAPELVFLDIHLPEGDGFEVVDALAATSGYRSRQAVVFVTAFSEHALRAFDVNAVDYLMKPFSSERFNTALDRVRDHLGRRAPADGSASQLARQRLPIEVSGRVLLLESEKIDYICAERNYVRIHAGQDTYRVRDTLASVADRLDSARFQRIHRSVIVALDRILEVETLDHGELALRLRSGVILISGRSYTGALRAALGLSAPTT